jgi:hypothetical protein
MIATGAVDSVVIDTGVIDTGVIDTGVIGSGGIGLGRDSATVAPPGVRPIQWQSYGSLFGEKRPVQVLGRVG